MLDEIALPFVSAAKPTSFIKWFASLGEIIQHPNLNDGEKLLWAWVAAQCANNMSFSCSLTYEQISRALNKPPRLVHRCLFRLLIMGFFLADIPVYYGEPTPEMVHKVRTITLNELYKKPLTQEDNRVFPRTLQKNHSEFNQ